MKNNGGPAFPCDVQSVEALPNQTGIKVMMRLPSSGMSVRDVFLASIAGGDWASQSDGFLFTASIPDETFEQRAELYGRMADAMLKEREKEETTPC